jgi:hypothetical protein
MYAHFPYFVVKAGGMRAGKTFLGLSAGRNFAANLDDSSPLCLAKVL